MKLKLKDGRAVSIRTVSQSDTDLIWDYFEHLSPESRHFFHPHPFDYENAAHVAAEADSPDSYRILAATGEGDSEKVLGYAWFSGIQERDFPSVGIGVIDEYQNKGIGTMLMSQLAEKARELNLKGLQLTVYKDNWRAMRVYSSQGYRIYGGSSDHKQHAMRLDFAEEDTPFKIRGMYLHCIPWNLTKLTADTWTFSDWKWYLELLHQAGCNMLKIYIWPSQFYHPDYEETAKNQWRYEVYKKAFRYARALGMKTYVAFSNNTTPTFVWLKHPELRAAEVIYRGMTLCWNRGKEAILPFSRYNIDYFADVVDGCVVWFIDPGFCACEECQDYTSVVLDSIGIIKEIIDGRCSLHLCLWWFGAIERGVAGLPENPNLRAKVLDTIKPGEFVIIDENEHDTMQMAWDRNLDVLKFAFFLDPENGTESQNILPQPKLTQIENAVSSSRESEHAGVIAYRLTPYTQFVSDWVFFRKLLFPDISTREILALLATRIFPDESARENFIRAILQLDEWWRTREISALQSATEILDGLRVPLAPFTRVDLIENLADATKVLLALAVNTDGDITSKIQSLMNEMPIFQAYTYDNLWEQTRARAFIERRVQWWLDYLK